MLVEHFFDLSHGFFPIAEQFTILNKHRKTLHMALVDTGNRIFLKSC
jgi:hypothetical protein